MSNSKTRILMALAASSGLIAASPALAATAGPAPVAVLLTIENSCTLNGTGTLNFGTRTTGTAATNIDATSTGLSITCAGTSPTATISVTGGGNAAGAQRRLRLGAAATFVPYDLYADAGRTAKIDPGANVNFPGGLPAGTTNVLIYGRIPAGTNLINGNGTNFTDTVSVSLIF